MIALDTNILIYALGMSEKAPMARRCVLGAMEQDAALPMQVLAELANVCRKKTLASAGELSRHLELLARTFRIIPTTLGDIERATVTAERHMLAFFDALIVTVAAQAGATTLLSEDMQDGLVIDRLRILNPFATQNEDALRALDL